MMFHSSHQLRIGSHVLGFHIAVDDAFFAPDEMEFFQIKTIRVTVAKCMHMGQSFHHTRSMRTFVSAALGKCSQIQFLTVDTLCA